MKSNQEIIDARISSMIQKYKLTNIKKFRWVSNTSNKACEQSRDNVYFDCLAYCLWDRYYLTWNGKMEVFKYCIPAKSSVDTKDTWNLDEITTVLDNFGFNNVFKSKFTDHLVNPKVDMDMNQRLKWYASLIAKSDNPQGILFSFSGSGSGIPELNISTKYYRLSKALPWMPLPKVNK